MAKANKKARGKKVMDIFMHNPKHPLHRQVKEAECMVKQDRQYTNKILKRLRMAQHVDKGEKKIPHWQKREQQIEKGWQLK